MSYFRFSDNAFLVASSLNELQDLINEPNQAHNAVGLKMNLKKTKIMSNSQVEEQMTSVKVDDITHKIVEEYLYLGQLIGHSTTHIPESNRRMKLEWSAFLGNSIIFKSRIRLLLKKKMFHAGMLYAKGTW